MYRVSSVPRPPLGLFLRECGGFGARRGALYGLICGAGYGLFFYLIGAVFGGPIGMAFGAAVGTLDGLICGLVLYRWASHGDRGQDTIVTRRHMLQIAIGVFSVIACVIGGYVVTDAERLVLLIQGGGIRYFYDEDVYLIIMPSLIAGLCGYAATGRLLRWYVKRWVLGEPESAVQHHTRAGVLSIDFWPRPKASPDSSTAIEQNQ